MAACPQNFSWFFVFFLLIHIGYGDPIPVDYREALAKCIRFFEAQRSGYLPDNQRVTWRSHSGLDDGSQFNIDLVGGYYDAGDNIKFGFPMAFTITMLAWSSVEYANQISQSGEFDNVVDAIRWGTDYLLKANSGPTELWVQVGDPTADHHCWERPEDMDTPRKLYKIDQNNPGTEIAAETAAALASSSIIFANIDPDYSFRLLQSAINLFDFADRYRGSFKGECPFYCSYNGYHDELLWAAAWLYKASSSNTYLDYILQNQYLSTSSNEFSWDNKFPGLQVLLSNFYFSGNTEFEQFKNQADRYFCSIIPSSSQNQVLTTPGGLIYVREGANTQYVTSAAFLAIVYADYVTSSPDQTLMCGSSAMAPDSLTLFALDQTNYILGQNPLGISYMVGYGDFYPLQAHHRGASIISVHDYLDKITCVEGFMKWFSNFAPNPNVLEGAIVGGPNRFDGFIDLRSNSAQLEPATYINAPFVGVLARLWSTYQSR